MSCTLTDNNSLFVLMHVVFILYKKKKNKTANDKSELLFLMAKELEKCLQYVAITCRVNNTNTVTIHILSFVCFALCGLSRSSRRS